MASPVPFDQVMETTTTTGTGMLTLAGAVSGFQSFGVVGDGGVCTYGLQAVDANGVPTGDREAGIGTYTLAGTKLSRDKILSSSNSGAAVNLSAGTKRVFLAVPAGSYGSAIMPPGPASGWTWANQGTATITDAPGGGLNMAIPDTAATNWRLFYKSVPATPYSVIARMQALQAYQNSTITGVYFYDGTKLMGVEFVAQNTAVYTLRVEKITNVNTDNSTAFSSSTFTINPFSGAVFVRLRSNGTSLFFDVSMDGLVWIGLFTEAVGTFITPTNAGFGGLVSTGTGFSARAFLSSWQIIGTAAA